MKTRKLDQSDQVLDQRFWTIKPTANCPKNHDTEKASMVTALQRKSRELEARTALCSSAHRADNPASVVLRAEDREEEEEEED